MNLGIPSIIACSRRDGVTVVTRQRRYIRRTDYGSTKGFAFAVSTIP
jgi:hypothetical protein